ncbi:MAG TPA: hypothetical protein DCG85_06960 [Lachnospiraceae bacterium]|nr:hypothetical protein [Lachnospiraceae bacterium]
MKQKKKSRFLTFIFSFLPGAAEMYMGFMKNGFSLMMVFFISFLPMMLFENLAFMMIISGAIWFYGFFHARNVAGMDDSDFMQWDDKYIWEEFASGSGKGIDPKTAVRWLAVVLILVGISQIWDYLYKIICTLIPENYWNDIYPLIQKIPQLAFSILFIIIGINLIKGKKKELDLSAGENTASETAITEIPKIEEKDLASGEV